MSYILLVLLQFMNPQEAQAQVSEIDCLTQNIYYEARDQSDKGKYAVAEVTINRTKSGIFPDNICGVVKQKDNGVCQFSWWCDKSVKKELKNKQYNKELYEKARIIAIDSYYKSEPKYVGNSLFYHAKYVRKSKMGVSKIKKTVTIGDHVFYALKG